MLPSFIIEQIKRREQEQREREQNSILQLPLPEYQKPIRRDDGSDEPDSSSVVIIDMYEMS